MFKKCFYILVRHYTFVQRNLILVCTIIILRVTIVILTPGLAILLFNYMSGMIKKHCMQKPVEIALSHSFENVFKPSQPCIKLFTCLCIECPFIIAVSFLVYVHNHQIRCRAIKWCWIAPFSAQIIQYSVVDVMVRVHYKVGSTGPCCSPASICNCCMKNCTCFINTNIIWP